MLQPSQLMDIAVRLWTSAVRLPDGRQFCSILNQAFRDDRLPSVEFATTIVHAIRTLRSGRLVRWPSSHITYRGTAMPRCYRDFFTVGKKYRAPTFLATSFDEAIAIETFLRQLPPSTANQTPPNQEPTLWRFHLDGSLSERRRCWHVNFIDRAAVGVPAAEFLYSPYSTFTVRGVQWHPEPIVNGFVSQMHYIDVDVASDNKSHPLDLPLAPWC